MSMSPHLQTRARQPRWPSAEVRAASEVDMMIQEHAVAGDPDLIERLALKVLLMFEPERPPGKVDLLVVDGLRARAAKIRDRRRC